MGKFTIFAVVVIGVVWGYGIYMDVESVYLPSCPIKKITDFDCPTCGTKDKYRIYLWEIFARQSVTILSHYYQYFIYC